MNFAAQIKEKAGKVETRLFKTLIQDNIFVLENLKKVILEHPELYSHSSSFANITIGQFTKKALNYYQAFFSGLEDKIEYDNFTKGISVEQDPEVAVVRINATINSLSALNEVEMPLSLHIIQETRFQLETSSTPERELQFLYFQAMQHLSMIMNILCSREIPFSQELSRILDEFAF